MSPSCSRYFARGGDQLISAASDYPLLSVCAARRSDGSLGLLFINKSSTAALNANVTIKRRHPGRDRQSAFLRHPARQRGDDRGRFRRRRCQPGGRPGSELLVQFSRLLGQRHRAKRRRVSDANSDRDDCQDRDCNGEPDAHSDPNRNSDRHRGTDPDLDRNAHSHLNANRDQHGDRDDCQNRNCNGKPDPHSNPNRNSDSHRDTDADLDENAHSHLDANCDQCSDRDGDRHANPDPCADADPDADCDADFRMRDR